MPALERAHSVTMDPHKWFFQAYDIGGLLVRDGTDLAVGFGGRSPEYYRGGEAATSGGDHGRTTATAPDDHGGQLNFYQMSFEGTRRWRALKLWMSWKHLGHDRLRAPHRGQRRPGGPPRGADRRLGRLRGRCRPSRTCRSCASGTCPAGARPPTALPAGDLDAHQDALQTALEISGDGWLTTTRLRDATYLRAGIVNYLATEDDIDRLLETLRRLAG